MMKSFSFYDGCRLKTTAEQTKLHLHASMISTDFLQKLLSAGTIPIQDNELHSNDYIK